MSKYLLFFFFQFITGFPGYNLSWMLLISHYIFKKLVCICSSSDWSFHSLARSMIMWEKGHGVTSPAADLLKLGHHEFIFWFRLMALSHLRKKVNFSPLFGITHWASSQSCVEVMLFFQTPNSSEKLHNFLFSFFFFFVEKHLKNKILTKIFNGKVLRFNVFLHFPINWYKFVLLFHFLIIAINLVTS